MLYTDEFIDVLRNETSGPNSNFLEIGVIAVGNGTPFVPAVSHADPVEGIKLSVCICRSFLFHVVLNALVFMYVVTETSRNVEAARDRQGFVFGMTHKTILGMP